jgi:hypothetical protein
MVCDRSWSSKVPTKKGTGVCTSDALCPKTEFAITQRVDARLFTPQFRLPTTRPDKACDNRTIGSDRVFTSSRAAA